MKARLAFGCAVALLALLWLLVFRSPDVPNPDAALVAVARPAGPEPEPGPASATASANGTAVATDAASAAVDKPEQPAPRGTIEGTVTDSSTREPIAGATVRVKEQKAVTDDDGRYELAGLVAGVHELLARADGHAEQMAQVNRSGEAASMQDFALDPAVDAVIRVVDEKGAPIEKARVMPPRPGPGATYWTEGSVFTDAQGLATLGGLSRVNPPRLAIEKDGYSHEYVQPVIGPNEARATATAILRKIRSRRWVIVGRVTDPELHPLSDVTVEWKDGGGTRFGSDETYGQFHAATDRDGRYRLEYEDDYDRCDLGVAAPGRAPMIAQGVAAGSS